MIQRCGIQTHPRRSRPPRPRVNGSFILLAALVLAGSVIIGVLDVGSPTVNPANAAHQNAGPASRGVGAPPVRAREAQALVQVGSPTDFERIHADLAQLQQLDTADRAGRESITRDLLARLGTANAAQVAADLTPAERKSDFGTAVLVRWLQADAATATAWIGEHPDLRPEQIWQLGSEFSATPATLAQLNAALHDPVGRSQLLVGGGLRAADTDPAYAATLAECLPAGAEQQDLLQTIAAAWTARDPLAAERFIASVADPAVREALHSAAARVVATADPDLGATIVSSAVQNPGQQHDAAISVVDLWSASHPAQAAAWVATFSPGSLRDDAIDLALARWLPVDRTGALAWAAQLPDHEKIISRLDAIEAERLRPKD